MKLATICYIDNGEQLLLLHRDKNPNDVHYGKWISVGGKFETGETPEECAKREILEETGLVANHLELCGFITFPDFMQDGEDWYSFVYRIRDFSGELLLDCPEGTLKWVDYSHVLEMPTWEGDYIFLKWILDEKPYFSAKFIYQANQLMDYSVNFIQQGENDENV